MSDITREHDDLYERVAEILETARSQVARTVNTAMVHAYWLVGREIVEVEQRGEARAGYGDELVRALARRLSEQFGRGFNSHTTTAAENTGCAKETKKRVHDLVASELSGARFVTKVLGRELGLS